MNIDLMSLIISIIPALAAIIILIFISRLIYKILEWLRSHK